MIGLWDMRMLVDMHSRGGAEPRPCGHPLCRARKGAYFEIFLNISGSSQWQESCWHWNSAAFTVTAAVKHAQHDAFGHPNNWSILSRSGRAGRLEARTSRYSRIGSRVPLVNCSKAATR